MPGRCVTQVGMQGVRRSTPRKPTSSTQGNLLLEKAGNLLTATNDEINGI
jgi:hypothetical protein